MKTKQYRLTKAEKARLDCLQADHGKDPASKSAAKHVFGKRIHEHRGAYEYKKRGVRCTFESIVFGNDGFEEVRVQKEVAQVAQRLEELHIPILGFGVEPEEGYSWAMRVECDDEDLLNLIVWDVWFEITCSKANPMKGELNEYLDEMGYEVAA